MKPPWILIKVHQELLITLPRLITFSKSMHSLYVYYSFHYYIMKKLCAISIMKKNTEFTYILQIIYIVHKSIICIGVSISGFKTCIAHQCNSYTISYYHIALIASSSTYCNGYRKSRISFVIIIILPKINVCVSWAGNPDLMLENESHYYFFLREKSEKISNRVLHFRSLKEFVLFHCHIFLPFHISMCACTYIVVVLGTYLLTSIRSLPWSKMIRSGWWYNSKTIWAILTNRSATSCYLLLLLLLLWSETIRISFSLSAQIPIILHTSIKMAYKRP